MLYRIMHLFTNVLLKCALCCVKKALVTLHCVKKALVTLHCVKKALVTLHCVKKALVTCMPCREG